MRRRTALGIFGGFIGGVAAHRYRSLLINPSSAMRAVETETDQLLGTDSTTGTDLPNPLDRAEWQNEKSQLEIWLIEDHNADFLAFVHEADESVLWSVDAPRFGGPVTAPALDAVACVDADWPSRTFELVAGTGTTSFGMVDEILARGSITVPEGWLARAGEHNVDQETCQLLTV